MRCVLVFEAIKIVAIFERLGSKDSRLNKLFDLAIKAKESNERNRFWIEYDILKQDLISDLEHLWSYDEIAKAIYPDRPFLQKIKAFLFRHQLSSIHSAVEVRQ